MRVVITGGTGVIGQELAKAFVKRGDTVVALSRGTTGASAMALAKIPGVSVRAWTGKQGAREPWFDDVDGAGAIINLAGEPVFGHRWDHEHRKRIHHSRMDATKAVCEAIRVAKVKPPVLVNASAVGYYGFTGDERLDETGRPGGDFLATVVADWETEAVAARESGVRVVLLRIGIVLGEQGGALSEMLTPFKLGVGGPLGTGRQWMSWVHVDDVVGLALKAIDDPTLDGPLNATAPEPVTNRDLSTVLGRVLHRPSLLSVPKFALKLVLGDVSEMIVNGQRVVPAKALAHGYVFKHPALEPALRSILAPS